jgi:hypothetical protein
VPRWAWIALLAALALALVLRGIVLDAGTDVVTEHWPGPAPSPSLRLVLALVQKSSSRPI